MGRDIRDSGDKEQDRNKDEEWKWGTKDGIGTGVRHRGERAPGFLAKLYRLSRGALHTAQSPSTKKRWPTGWQIHCMARGTAPLCARQAWRAPLRKKRCGGEGRSWAVTLDQAGLRPRPQQGLEPTHNQLPHLVQLPAQGIWVRATKTSPQHHSHQPNTHSLSENARPSGDWS